MTRGRHCTSKKLLLRSTSKKVLLRSTSKKVLLRTTWNSLGRLRIPQCDLGFPRTIWDSSGRLRICQDNLGLIHSTKVHRLHWFRCTKVPFVLELNLSSTGVPLEKSTGAPGDAPGHGQAVPQPGACLGHQTHG